MMPAPEGTGVLAGGAVPRGHGGRRHPQHPRQVPALQQPQNVVAATMQGLMSLRNAEQVAAYAARPPTK